MTPRREKLEVITDLSGAAFQEAMAAIVRKTELVSHSADKMLIVTVVLAEIAAKYRVLSNSSFPPFVTSEMNELFERAAAQSFAKARAAAS